MKKYGRERLKKVYQDIKLPQNTKCKGYIVFNEPDNRYLIDMVGEGLLWSNLPDDALVFKKHKKALEIKKISEEDDAEVGLLFDTGELIIPIAEKDIQNIIMLLNKK